MSTIDDLLLWDRNFYANRLGKRTLVKELETRGVLNSGKPINYALGFVLGNLSRVARRRARRSAVWLPHKDTAIPGAEI